MFFLIFHSNCQNTNHGEVSQLHPDKKQQSNMHKERRQEKTFHPVLVAEDPYFKRVSTSVVILISLPCSMHIKAATVF
jgi:hypothetical protein